MNDELTKLIEQRLQGINARLRYTPPAADFRRAVQDEMRRFDRDFPHFDQVSWILEGLEVLADGAGAFYLLVPEVPHQRRSMADVRAALEAKRVELTELREAGEVLEHADTDMQRTIAWIEQPEYLIWLRAQIFEERLVDLIRDDPIAFTRGDGPDLQEKGRRLWDEIVLWWNEDRERGTDRVQEGKV